MTITSQQFYDIEKNFHAFSILYDQHPSIRPMTEAIWLFLYADYEVENSHPIFKSDIFTRFRKQTIGQKLLATLAAIRFSYAIANMKNPDDLQESTLENIIQNILETEDHVTSLLKDGANSTRLLEKTPLHDQLNIADALEGNNDLQSIAVWAKKFKLTAKKRRYYKKTKTFLKGKVVKGGKMERLTAEEYLKSESPEAALDFMYRLSENRAKMYDYKMRNRIEKGAMIVCYDESGSMSELDAQGKGLILSLMAIAKQEKRDFVFIPFSGQVDENSIQLIFKGKYTAKNIVKLADSYIGGGTNFESPLLHTLEYMRKLQKRGDIIFITDGISHISDELVAYFNAIKAKQKFYFVAILVGRNQHPGRLKEIADDIIAVQDFQDDTMDYVFSL